MCFYTERKQTGFELVVCQNHGVLETGLCLHDINVTMMLKKCKGAYDSVSKYGWMEMTFTWVQKVADGSVCQL